MQEISQIIINLLEKDIQSNGYANLIVSGGSSPVKIFEDLSNASLDWSKVNISLVDDRLVDKSHKDSNEKLVKDVLMSARAGEAKFISICNESIKLANLERPYSVMLLGMGDDGHFASLFPKLILSNPDYFDLSKDPEIFVTEPMGNPNHKRVSMNLSMILDSKNIFLLVSSENKMKVLNKARTNKSLPLFYLLNQDKSDIKIFNSF